MVNLTRRHRDPNRLTISDWDGALPDAPSSSEQRRQDDGGPMGGGDDEAGNGASTGSSTRSDLAASSSSADGAPSPAPEMNLSSVYSSMEDRRRASMDDPSVEGSLEAADGHVGPKQHHQQRDSLNVNPAGSLRAIGGNNKRTKADFKLFRRRTDQSNPHDDDTVAPSSSASRTSYSSSAGTNIWTKLLGGHNSEGVWDGLDGKDAFEDTDSLLGDEDDPTVRPGCLESTKKSARRAGLSWWYETRHFFKTIWRHPLIGLASLAAFGILCGVGMAAINAERDAYVKKQQGMVGFIAQETGEWFQNEFRKAMLPLYSVQQAVTHSGYFNDLADKVGDYPLNVIPETDYIADPSLTDVPGGRVFRNLTGICDDPVMQQRFQEIVAPVNKDNNIDDGSVFAYRLAPRNTFCLYERDDPESNPDKNLGFDTGVSFKSGFWKQVTSDIFAVDDIKRERGEEVPESTFSMPGMSSGQVYSIFGPFGQPDKEWVCGHLPVYYRESDLAVGPLNVHGTDVENGWGFVMNYLDWRLLKDRSNIYERFSGCNVEFELTRKVDGVVLARSDGADLLTEENSILVETESLHGVWVNRVGRVYGWEPNWYEPAVAGVVIGSLIIGFLVASTLVERQLHRDLVGKMLPRRAIVKLHRGQTVLEKYNLVTIFFSDIVGFTSMAGSMRPIQVMKMLNELYTELDRLVAKHQVYKVETIGDAYMVVGGAPNRVPAPLAAERVALFAIDAINFVKNWRTQDGDQVFIRAGLASGPTVAGVVGQAMPRYCFFGDTVNFASRMESTSKKMRIQCADITYRLLMDAPNMDFQLIKRMEGDVAGVQVKGKGHVITYWVEKSSLRGDGQRLPAKMIEPFNLDKVDEDEEAEAGNAGTKEPSDHSGADYEEFLKVLARKDETQEQEDLAMYTADEIYAAMTGQGWQVLGHAENALVAATDDRQKMIIRASALLEHHLSRVFEARDAGSKLPPDAKDQIKEFVGDIAATYSNVHFHNLSHALHVMTNMNKLISESRNEEAFNTFSLVFSALVHDAGHTGMSNKILTDIHHPLSDKYEDGVPLAERESIAIALDLLFRPEYEALRVAIIPGVIDKIAFAKTLFQSILVTDIATPDRVKLGIKRYEVSQDEQGKYDTALCPLVPYLDSVLSGVGLEESDKEEHPKEFIITHCGLQNCVRNEHLMLLSDVGHLMQGWENFVKWNFRLYKEINDSFKKGFCDDPRKGWCDGQVGFLNHYIIPLAKRSTAYLKESGEALTENAVANLDLWKRHGAKASEIMINAVDEGEDESSVLIRLYELPSL